MKKYLTVFIAFLFILTLSACGDSAADKEKQTGTGTGTASVTEEEHDHGEGPHEPGEEDVCAFCNMKVYTEGDHMGVFTAQAKTADGKYVFFDDSGCLLNSERKDDIKYAEKWVRDYVTSEWIEADTGVPVKADLKTPMKYGYAFFTNQESAEKFISENEDKHAELSSWETIDQVANERYMKKMKMQGGMMENKEDRDMEHKEDMEGN